MSHMVKGTTTFREEHKAILLEALTEAYSGCTIEHNTQAQIRGRPMCDIVVKRRGRNDIGFRLNSEDGTYECLAYEGGYMDSQTSINKALEPVYEPYIKGTTKKMMRNSPVLSSYIMGKTEDITAKDGKKKKRIRLRPSAGGGGGWI